MLRVDAPVAVLHHARDVQIRVPGDLTLLRRASVNLERDTRACRAAEGDRRRLDQGAVGARNTGEAGAGSELLAPEFRPLSQILGVKRQESVTVSAHPCLRETSVQQLVDAVDVRGSRLFPSA